MASICAIIARIGGGKSLYGTIQIMRELERTDRLIVTDIPLILIKPPVGYWTVSDYCHEFIKRPIDVQSRVVVLTEEQACEFWRYLPAGRFTDYDGCELIETHLTHSSNRILKLPNKEHKLFNEVPDFSFRTVKPENRVGCYYVIDEAHKKFPPMHYQRIGAQAEWYMSELRKLDDDLDWITQHPEKVDKNFRRNLTESIQVQNMGRSTLFAGVTLPNRFRWHWYNQPDLPARGDKPTASGWYKIEKKRRFHHLYKTMDGTGVSGGLMQEGSRFRGRHWSVYIVIVLAILGFSIMLPWGLQKITDKVVFAFLHGVEKGTTAGLNKALPSPKPAPAPAPVPISVAPPTPAMIPSPPQRQPVSLFQPDTGGGDGLTCVGWCQEDTNMMVMLSDGSIARSQFGEVQGIGSRFVRVFGLPPIPVSVNVSQKPRAELGGGLESKR